MGADVEVGVLEVLGPGDPHAAPTAEPEGVEHEGVPEVDDGPQRESESAPNPLTGRVPSRHHCRCGGTEADHGEPCPKHTAEFKRRAVQPYNERGTAYAEVAREVGVDPSGPADWVGRASAAAPDAEADPFQMAGDLRRPRRGNERLKREDEMLLEASAFLAGRRL